MLRCGMKGSGGKVPLVAKIGVNSTAKRDISPQGPGLPPGGIHGRVEFFVLDRDDAD
jgi:hypothetical protein